MGEKEARGSFREEASLARAWRLRSGKQQSSWRRSTWGGWVRVSSPGFRRGLGATRMGRSASPWEGWQVGVGQRGRASTWEPGRATVEALTQSRAPRWCRELLGPCGSGRVFLTCLHDEVSVQSQSEFPFESSSASWALCSPSRLALAPSTTLSAPMTSVYSSPPAALLPEPCGGGGGGRRWQELGFCPSCGPTPTGHRG